MDRGWQRAIRVAYNGRFRNVPDANLIAVNGLTLLVVLALAIGIVVAWRVGVLRGRREAQEGARDVLRPAVMPQSADEPPAPIADESNAGEDLRRVQALEAENAALCSRLDEADRALAAAHAETGRYRELVVDIENNAPPPLLDGRNAPDDLKLIVGIGPVLERMLHKLGVTTYRQIARWSEREIEEFDARLPEFPGRIRRDAWVTQARELHQSKFGEALPTRTP